MRDNLVISNKIKKTILYLEVMTSNYPKSEYILKNKILDKSYDLLEFVIGLMYLKIYYI